MDKGDHVLVTMQYTNVFPWQSSEDWVAEYVAGPRGAGDVFTLKVADPSIYFKYHKDIDTYIGTEVKLNGNSSSFIAIRSIEYLDDNKDGLRPDNPPKPDPMNRDYA